MRSKGRTVSIPPPSGPRNQLTIIVLITGVSPQSVGSGTAIAFASQSPQTLILASRTQSKLEGVASEIQSQYPSVNVKLVSLDLSSQESIRNAAKEISNSIDQLDLLVNNAGVVVLERQWTPEGIELQFGTNHIGPFLFTNLLLPLMIKAAQSSSSKPASTRIINVSSHGHRLSPVRFHDWNFEKNHEDIPEEERPFSGLSGPFAKTTEDGYPGFIAYGQSKTANVLFTVYLQERLKEKGIMSYSLHPGGKPCRPEKSGRF
jgi:NAD(P)-dependent dehydrogenase (short-subunit alcohol dehydrogenase family)